MRILIVDDEPELLNLLADLLTRKGHQIVSCTNGADALRKFTDDGPFDCVVTDYQMPRKNGVVLIMDIRKQKPDQKVILVSGDPPQIPDFVRKDTGEFPILEKPYHNAELLDLLK